MHAGAWMGVVARGSSTHLSPSAADATPHEKAHELSRESVPFLLFGAPPTRTRLCAIVQALAAEYCVLSRPQPPQTRYPTRRPTKQPVSQSQCSFCLCVVLVQPHKAYAAEMPSLVTPPTAADAKPDGLSNKTSDAAADDQDTDKGAHKGAHHRSYRCICAARVDSSPAAASARNSSQQQHMHPEPPANSLVWGKARAASQPAPPAGAS